jgi:hypothetical protein
MGTDIGDDREYDDAAWRFRGPNNHVATPAMANAAAPPMAMPAIAPPEIVGAAGGERLAAGEVAESVVVVAGEVTRVVEEVAAGEIDDAE